MLFWMMPAKSSEFGLHPIVLNDVFDLISITSKMSGSLMQTHWWHVLNIEALLLMMTIGCLLFSSDLNPTVSPPGTPDDIKNIDEDMAYQRG